jgi:hypothetical protein
MLILRAAAVALAIGIAALAAPTLALAQQAISEFSNVSYVVFCTQDIDTLDKAAHLSAAQRDSAESLMRAAVAEARLAFSGYIRRQEALTQDYIALLVRDPDASTEARKKYRVDCWNAGRENAREIAAVERKTLNDLRSILSSDQLTNAWPTFERARRRLVLAEFGWPVGVGIDPLRIVQSARLSPEDQAMADVRLAEYDLAIDPLLAKLIDSLVRNAKEQTEYDPERSQRPDPMAPKVYKLNVQTLQSIERDVSADGRKAIQRCRAAAQLSEQFPRPGASEDVKRIVALGSLTTDQRAEIERLIKEGEAAMLAAAVEELRHLDDAALREVVATEEDEKRSRTLRRTAYSRTYEIVGRLRAVLTPPQREGLDLAAIAELDKLNHIDADPFKTTRIRPDESEWAPKAPPAAAPSRKR